MANYDISQTGYNDYLELLDLNEDYQGLQDPLYDNPPSKKQKLTQKQLDQIRQQLIELRRRESVERLGFKPYNGIPDISGYDPRRENLKDLYIKSSVADTDIPFGESRYDENVSSVDDLYNIEDVRARYQSRVNKIASGLGKMSVIAGTTFADDLIGPIEGVFNIGKQAARGNIHRFGDVVDAYVENPASKWILGLNEQAENWFPTYYTNEEKDAHWYDIWYHASFIGDHFLKNAGYMLGAYLGSKAFSIPLSKAFKVNEARNVFKNTALAMGMEDKTYQEVLKAYKTGKTLGSGLVVTESLAQAAKNAKHADTYLKLASTAFGSIGESRMEAITNSDDWFNKNKQVIDLENQDLVDLIPLQIQEEHPEFFGQVPVVDPSGRIVGYQNGIIDRAGYENEYSRKETELKQKYENDLSELTKQRIDYSNASFGINFLLTYGENLNIFGDAITGSWSKRSKFNRRIKRNQEGLKLRGISKPLDIGMGIVRGPVFEGVQEMALQATVTHLNRRHANRLNQYYGDVIDKDGLDYETGFMRNFMSSLGDTFADADEWENFALGAVTALLPLPTRMNVLNKVLYDENGKPKQGQDNTRSKIVAGGELWESIREARQKYKDTEALVKALNDIESDPNRANQFYDLVKQDRLNKLQLTALDEGDQKLYKDLEFEKLASTVMVYSDAGQMKYLKDLIDLIYTVETPDLIQAIRSTLTYTEKQGDKEVTKSLFDDMEDDEITEYFEGQKQQVLEKIEKFNKIYNNINELYGDFGEGQSPVYRKTLALNIMSIDDRELRIKDLSSKVLDYFRKYAEQFGSGLIDEQLTDEQRQYISEISDAIESLNDITNLNIALGNDGFLLKLDNIRRDEMLSLNEKFNKITDLILQELKYIDEEYQSPETGKKQAYLDYIKRKGLHSREQNKLRKQLKFINDNIDKVVQSVDATTKGLDFTKEIHDLLSLLGDREMLYDELAILSGIGGPELFFEGLSMDIAVMLDNYREQYTGKFYDQFSKSHNIDDIPDGLFGIFKNISKKKNDLETDKYLDLYDKYIFGQDSLIGKIPEDLLLSLNYLYQMINQIIAGSENADLAQKDIFDAFMKEDNQELKNFLVDFEEGVKQQKSQRQKTSEGTSEMETPLSTENENAEDDYGHLVNLERNEMLKFSNNKNLLWNFLNFEGNEGLMSKFAIKAGYDEELTGTIQEYVQSFINQSSPETILNIMNELFDESVAVKSNPLNGEQEEPEAPEQEEEPESAPEPEPEEEDSEYETLTMDESNDEFDDNVSDSQDLNVDQVEENNTPFVISPEDNPRSEAEDIMDDLYLDSKGEDLIVDDNADVPDVWDVNRYSARFTFEALRQRQRRMLLIYRHNHKTGFMLFTDWLNNEYKVLEFIDSGFLNKVIEYNKGKAKVRFVGVNNEDFILDKSVGYKQKKLEDTIFAAIEIPQELREEYDNAGFKLIDFKDKDGNTTQMQILGVITPQKVNGTVLNVNKYADSDFDNIRELVYHERHKISEANGEDVEFMAYDIYSNIEYVYSGRFVKLTESIPYGERPVSELLSNEQQNEPDGNLQIRLYVKNDKSIDVGSELGGEVVELNTKTFSSINAARSGRNRAGSVWIMTKEADGKVYHKGARLIDFDAEYYDKHKTDRSNPYITGIRNAVNMIVNAKTNDQIKQALHLIQKYLYFPEHNGMVIKMGKKGNPNRYLLINNEGQDTTVINLGDRDATKQVLNAIINKGYKFSIGTTSLKDVVDSDILMTDLAELHNKNASFTISKIVDGNPVNPEKTHSDTNPTYEQTGGMLNGNSYNISGSINGVFKIMDRTNIVIDTKTGNPITDNSIIQVVLKCYEIDTQNIKGDENLMAFQNTGNAGVLKSVYVVRYQEKNGTTSYQAFMYSKFRNHRRDVYMFDRNESMLIGKVKFEGYKPESKDSRYVNSIREKLGIKEDNNLKDAAKSGKGIKETQENPKQKLSNTYIKQGDRIQFVSITDEGDDGLRLSGVVLKTNNDNSVDVLVDGTNNVVRIDSSSVLHFFGKSNGFKGFKITAISRNDNAQLNALLIQPVQQLATTQSLQSDQSTTSSRANSIIRNGRKSSGYKFTNPDSEGFYVKYKSVQFGQFQLRIFSLMQQRNVSALDILKNLDNRDLASIPELNETLEEFIKKHDEDSFNKFMNVFDSVIKCA